MRRKANRLAEKRNPLSSEDWTYHRRDIYMADLDPARGSEQGGIRPVLILQNNTGNRFSPTLIVAPMTTQLKKTSLPTHVVLGHVPGLTETSMVSLEQIETIDKGRILSYVGKLTRTQMLEVEAACLISLGVSIPDVLRKLIILMAETRGNKYEYRDQRPSFWRRDESAGSCDRSISQEHASDVERVL